MFSLSSTFSDLSYEYSPKQQLCLNYTGCLNGHTCSHICQPVHGYKACTAHRASMQTNNGNADPCSQAVLERNRTEGKENTENT